MSIYLSGSEAVFRSVQFPTESYTGSFANTVSVSGTNWLPQSEWSTTSSGIHRCSQAISSVSIADAVSSTS
ncbi:hypothetical protein [Microbulbifer sp. ZKSA002]|uniref:hypothetical protein n=1 Tax=Microbulbifer sp. ZKSA002 TaxID=3243388 RepID=UPI00403A74E2